MASQKSPRKTTQNVTAQKTVAVCKLDRLNETVVDDAIAAARASLGITEAQVRGFFNGGSGGGNGGFAAAVLGDVSQCSAVKTNRIIDIARVAVLVITAVVVALMVIRGRMSGWLWTSLKGLELTSYVLAALALRHVLALFGKLVWFGLNKESKANLVLYVAGVVLATALGYLKTAGSVSGLAIAVLVLVGAVSVARAVLVVRSMRKKNAPTDVIASVASAANRVATTSKIAALTSLVNKATAGSAKLN